MRTQQRPGSSSPDVHRPTARILDLQADGRGRATEGARAVVIPQAYPGEVVEYRVDVSTKGALQGRVLSVRQASADRVSHPCAHEFHCTGCPFVSLSAAAEARFKETRVRSALGVSGSGDSDSVSAVIVPTSPFGYRHFAKQMFARHENRIVLGSFVQGTHHVTDNEGCPVLAPQIQRALAMVRAAASQFGADVHSEGEKESRRGLRHVTARLSRATGGILLTVTSSTPGARDAVDVAAALYQAGAGVVSAWAAESTTSGNNLLDGDARLVAGEPTLEEAILGYRYSIGPKSFFQINPAAAEVMFGRALDWAGRGASIVELFTGVGTLALPLSERFTKVVAIESSVDAAECARSNAARAGRSNVDVRTGDVEAMVDAVLAEATPEVVLADPPRKGLGSLVPRAIGRSRARSVVLISCDPVALGRDAQALKESGFRLTSVQPVDQFPRTAHVECVSRFDRAG